MKPWEKDYPSEQTKEKKKPWEQDYSEDQVTTEAGEEPKDDYPILSSFQDAAASAVTTVGKGIDVVNKYSGANTLRNFVGTGELKYPLASEDAKGGKEILANLGVSEEGYEIGPILDPKTRRRMSISAAGVLGGGLDMATDPLTYVGGPTVEALSKVGAEGLAKVGKSVSDYAAEKAVATSVGKGRKAMQASKVDPNRPGSIDRMLNNMHERGRMLMRKDDAGGPVLGRWNGTPRSVAEKSEKKQKFYGERIGQTDDVIDELVPEGVNAGNIAYDILEYNDSLNKVGKSKRVSPLLEREADNFLDLKYDLSEKGKRLGASETRKLKEEFPYTEGSPNELESSKKASNKMNQVLQDQIRLNKEKALKRAESEEQISLLNNFDDSHKRYGAYSDVAELSAVEAGHKMGPATALGVTATGLAPAAISLTQGVSPVQAALAGAGVAGAYLLKTRGPAFVARGADDISRMMLAPKMWGSKYSRQFQQAAKMGAQTVVGLHHQLMNSDSQYRNIVTGRETEE